MNKRQPLTRALSAILLSAALVFCLVPAQRSIVIAQGESKEALTPTFWQKDPDANFEDEGRMHCGPAAVSDGLIYLTKAFGLKGLVPGTDHDNQIKLVKELADESGTDPSEGGTSSNGILTGLQSYVKSKGFEFSRLEIMTTRRLSDENKQFKKGTKPDISWMREAANSKDTVVLFNFGWYHKTDDGYVRKGGHWINIVGGSGNEFIAHNPILRPEVQSEKKSVNLTLMDEDFIVANDSNDTNLKGYYEGEGPGLPYGSSVEAAILNTVIVFSLKKSE